MASAGMVVPSTLLKDGQHRRRHFLLTIADILRSYDDFFEYPDEASSKRKDDNLLLSFIFRVYIFLYPL